MNDTADNSGNSADDMSEYLQTFLDETEEQLDDLIETMLALEENATNKEDLNEAFRLIHSIKGSAGIMGFENITVLTHRLENRFERFRSGLERLDERTMNLVLRCIDFLRQCSDRLRKGAALGSPTELLEELIQLEEEADPPTSTEVQLENVAAAEVSTGAIDSSGVPSNEQQPDDDTLLRMVVRFRHGLQLIDLKARLIVTRLSGLGQVHVSLPPLDPPAAFENLESFEIRIDTEADHDQLRAAVDVEGVESVDFPSSVQPSIPRMVDPMTDASGGRDGEEDDGQDVEEEHRGTEPGLSQVDPMTTAGGSPPTMESVPVDGIGGAEPTPAVIVEEPPTLSPVLTGEPQAVEAVAARTEKAPAKVAETVRVDIDRLDTLMNLTGELVVNRARLEQISGEVSPALRKSTMQNRVRDFRDSLQRTIAGLEGRSSHEDWSAEIQQLREGLELMDQQSDIWDNGRHCFNQMSDAIDQLSRVSHGLQRGVLDTRMVPVGPLFNRFRHVVRDLSKQRGKQVTLVIRGEKTELDKRMIDELGDPLVHLVRNSIDHGLETCETRLDNAKTETGTIVLEASHRGNNVFIHVKDDGQGIDVDKIRARLVKNRVLTESAAAELSEDQTLEYIWHPGFSTASEVTDVSGRGVGMDVVRTRIEKLSGQIEVESVPGQGTSFRIRLPLTLAIIHSLLVRMRNVVFSIPMDDVREIVSVKACDVVTVHGKQTFEVRGEYLPLSTIDRVFRWHNGHDDSQHTPQTRNDLNDRSVDVVILQSAGKTIGLRVDDFLGSQDIVIKSLSDNFVDVRGLSGASILGDGGVSLMLDVTTVIAMANEPSSTASAEKKVT